MSTDRTIIQVRSPAIRGRPSPQRKTRSALGSSDTSAGLPVRNTISKAHKRAQRRSSLLDRARNGFREDEHKSARSLLKDGEDRISKSSLRRRKRKARDQLAKNDEEGREGGVGELREVVEELENDLSWETHADVTGLGSTKLYKAENHPVQMTANQRKRVLYVGKRRGFRSN